MAPRDRSFSEMRDEWKSLKDRIKEQVKKELEGGPERWREVRHEIRREFRQARRYGMPDADSDSEVTSGSAFQIYKEKRLRRANSATAGFVGHLIPFAAVNGFLALLYFTLTPGAHPWFLYPLFGWGIGLFSHWTAVKAAQASARELERLDEASDTDLVLIKKYQSARGGFWSHLGSNTAVSVFLLMIWTITGAGFPWPLIPIGAMAIGVFSHLSGFLARRSEFRPRWKALLSGGSLPNQQSKPAVTPIDADPLVRKATGLRDSILVQAESLKGSNPFGEDMAPTLDNYVRQIGELSAIEQELGRVVAAFDAKSFDAEEVAVRAKIAATSSGALKLEYEKSLTEMAKQKKSFKDLAEQQEILNLRIKSAVGNLQQIQIDLARIKGLTDGQKESSFVSLKERSEELSRYLEDYREGLKEFP